MKNILNNDTKTWIASHGCAVEEEPKMVADVRLFASDWEIKNFDGIEDKDSYNPIYAGQSEKIKELKKKPYWKLINPVYRLYANIKVRTILFSRMDKKAAFVKLKNKIAVKWKNRKTVVMRRNKAFLKSITLSEEELKAQRGTVFTKKIKISVIVPLYNTPERFLRDMIESVTAQTYADWELCMGDGSDVSHPEVERICKEYASKDARIIYRRLEKNEGISGNTNECLKFATGEYVALFDHDDMLHPAALFRCMEEIEKHDAEFIYTDEMTFEHDSIRKIATLHFKPAYSPQNLNGVNYICHLCVFKKSLLAENGVYNDAYDGSQDHDMILRLTTAAEKVSHIPEILYFWRVHPQSVSMNINAKSYAIDAGRRAVHDNELRLGREAEIHSSCICATHYRLDYKLEREPEITVIVASYNDGKALGRLLDSMEKRTYYDNYRVMIADMGSTDEETKQFLDTIKGENAFTDASEKRNESDIAARNNKTNSQSKGLDDVEKVACQESKCLLGNISVRYRQENENLAAFLNRLVASCETEYVVFLESNMEIMDEKWLKRLVQYEMQEDIGLTASRLTDKYGMVNEAGYIIGLGDDGIALPIEHKNNYSAPGYMGRMYYAHNISAASVWGMMIQKDTFLAQGGFDTEITAPYYLGIDLSLKFRAADRQVVMEPYVINMQYKEALFAYYRENEAFADKMEEILAADAAYMREKWHDTLTAGDPYYNRNLNRDGSWTFER